MLYNAFVRLKIRKTLNKIDVPNKAHGPCLAHL